MPRIELRRLDGEYAIHRLPAGSATPASLDPARLFFIGNTPEELSVVCPADTAISGSRISAGWSCLQVVGPLDFNLCGILAGLSAALAKADIGIFAVSTFDTDYILVKEQQADAAIRALETAGYRFRD